MNNTIIWQILVQVLLISLNAVFACAEIAVISMNDNKLAQMAAQGDKRAIRLARLTSQPARFLATIQVAITLSGFLGSAFAAENFSSGLVSLLLRLKLPIPASTLSAISVFIITLILSYFTLVFGELVPKRIAMKKAEQLALGMSAGIAFISRIFAPLVGILTASTNLILRAFQIDPNEEDNEISEEEIRMMVDAGNKKGVIDTQEKEFIQNIFEFDDISIEEFATHRTQVAVLWLEESLDEWEQTMHEARHTCYPVCEETIDNVIGILNIKDYFSLSDKSKENVIQSIIKNACFVPESISADQLFRQMQQSRNHFAVVLDEYGGMTGIVTMNDLLEQLVGDLDDNFAAEADPDGIHQLTEDVWEVVGNVFLDDVEEELHSGLPIDDYDTFSGFVLGTHGAIPEDGATFELTWKNMMIQVIEIKNHTIYKAIITMNETAPGS